MSTYLKSDALRADQRKTLRARVMSWGGRLTWTICLYLTVGIALAIFGRHLGLFG